MPGSSRFASDLSPEYALMGFLSFQALHGYDLHRRLTASLSGVWRVTQSQVYAILKRLERQGAVCAVRQQQASRPARDCYQLTEAGRARFEAWLIRPTPPSARAIRVEFITRLFFAGQVGEDLPARLIQDQMDALKAELIVLDAQQREQTNAAIYTRLSLELRRRQLVTAFQWLEECGLVLGMEGEA